MNKLFKVCSWRRSFCSFLLASLSFFLLLARQRDHSHAICERMNAFFDRAKRHCDPAGLLSAVHPYSFSKRRTCRLPCCIRRNTAGSGAASQCAFVSPPAQPPRRPRPGCPHRVGGDGARLAPSGEAARCRRQPLIAAALPTQSSSSPLLARPAAFNHRSPAPLRSRVDG